MGILGTLLGGTAGFFLGGPVGAALGAGIGSGVDTAQAQSSAASAAANAQTASAQAGIDEQRRQFDAIQKLLQPYSQAGTAALGQQQVLLGLTGPQAQQDAISALASGPQMQALTQQGENALLQNASATGGLRGGNLEAALAKFRPQLLNQLIQNQYTNLSGLSSIGQNAAAGVGNAGQNTGNAITNLLQQQGAAQAGSALASGQASAGLASGIGSTATMLGALKLLGKF